MQQIAAERHPSWRTIMGPWEMAAHLNLMRYQAPQLVHHHCHSTRMCMCVCLCMCLYASIPRWVWWKERCSHTGTMYVWASEKKKPWGRTLNVGLHHPSPYISEHVCGSIRPAQYQSDTLQTVRRCTECTFRFPAVSFFSPPLVDDGGERDMELGGYVLFVS